MCDTALKILRLQPTTGCNAQRIALRHRCEKILASRFLCVGIHTRSHDDAFSDTALDLFTIDQWVLNDLHHAIGLIIRIPAEHRAPRERGMPSSKDVQDAHATIDRFH